MDEKLKTTDIAKFILKNGMIETFEWGDKEIFTEEVNGKEETFVKGKFLKKEHLSRNRRKYTTQFVEDFVEQVNNSEDIVMWVTHHPSNPLMETAAKVVEAWEDGEWAFYKARILETQAGQTIKTLISEGLVKHVSVRYIPIDYNIDEENNQVEMLKGKLMGIDYVQNPGVVGASATLSNEDMDDLEQLLENVDNTLLVGEIKEVIEMAEKDKKPEVNTEEEVKNAVTLETLQEQLSDALAENKKLKEAKDKLNEKFEKMAAEVQAFIEEQAKGLKDGCKESLKTLVKSEDATNLMILDVDSIKFEEDGEKTLSESFAVYAENITGILSKWQGIVSGIKADITPKVEDIKVEDSDKEEDKPEVEDDNSGDNTEVEDVKANILKATNEHIAIIGRILK